MTASAHARGYGRDWQRVRTAFLSRFPLCRLCLAGGRTSLATVVDHIVPFADHPRLRLDTSNLQPLCGRCNSRKVHSDRRIRFGGGWEIPPPPRGGDGLAQM